MISQTDTQGRLRLFRYGLVVVVIVTFLISLLAPYAAMNGLRGAGIEVPSMGDFIGTAILYSIVVAVIAVVAYAVYHYFLTKSWPMMGSK